MPGTLYVVPTPIGNLEDITYRAVRILASVNLILAEDTRTTAILLRHYDLHTPTQSYHLHNEHDRVNHFVDLLLHDQQLALVSDAGTPAISDPGFLLVRAALAQQIPVTCLPGPTALIPALVASGFPCEKFLFEGFLPPKKGRQKRLLALREQPLTAVLYESPYRLPRLLQEIQTVFGPDQLLCLARELSKLHESFYRGPVDTLINTLGQETIKGECVLIIAPRS